jgi:hypothetical protein
MMALDHSRDFFGIQQSSLRQTRAHRIRGWLIFLELTVFRCLGFQFNFDDQFSLLNVLWALGWAMIVLSALVYLPPSVVHSFWRGIDRVSQPFGFGAIKQPSLGHPAFTEFYFYDAAPLGIRYLHIDSLGGRHRGRLRPRASLRIEAKSPESFLSRAGLAVAAAFVAIRAINFYGDPIRWSAQKSPVLLLFHF